jgi:hypothetical protein
MLQLLRQYLRLMRTHDFSYHYSDDYELWRRENDKRVKLLMFRSTLLLTQQGRWFVTKAERRYGHV